MTIFSGIKDLTDLKGLTESIAETIGVHPHREIEIPDQYEPRAGDDQRFMARALKLAEKGLYTTHPNPRVGCIVTRNGVVVGEGYHAFTGQSHAEINALKQAGKYAEGGTLYVNLEPCCHHGRTPPCTDAIIKSGIRRVVMAMEDPNPLVNRAGISALKKAGIEVESGINRDQAAKLNCGFVKRVTSGIPWVTLKIAISLDGKTAMISGESQWITSEPARRDAHHLRARSSAILTGIGTVLRDDPHMTARVEGVVRQPLRVILDSRLSTPVDARILSEEGDVLIVTSPPLTGDADMYGRKNVEVIGCPVKESSIDLEKLMKELGRREINNLMLEAGANLSGSMLQKNLVDELVIYMSPDLLGSSTRGMFEIPGLVSIADKIKLTFTDVRQVGRDLRLTLSVSSH